MKNEYKSKLDEYSDKDSTLDKMNYNSALKAYNNQTVLDDSVEDARRSAYINQQKILKYLPNTLKAKGLSNNFGANQQAILDANNQYQTTLNEINKNYDTQSMAIQNAYSDEMTNNMLQQKNYSASLIPGMQEQFYSMVTEDATVGGYKTEDLTKLKDYVDSNNELLDEDKKALHSYIDANFKLRDEDRLKLVTTYGVSAEDEGIDNNSASVYSFGSFRDTGTGKGNQDNFVNDVLKLAKMGKIGNGTIVNFNYGNGSSSNYIYMDGRWYKTSQNATFDYKDWESRWKNSSILHDIQHKGRSHTYVDDLIGNQMQLDAYKKNPNQMYNI